MIAAKPKQARNKVPQKQWWGLAFKVLLLLVWVAAAVIVAQLIVGYLMLWMLGRETFLQPVPTAIYSALSYILALAWIFKIKGMYEVLKNTNPNANDNEIIVRLVQGL